MSHEQLLLFILCLLVVRRNAARQSCDTSLLNTKGKFSKADVSDLISINNREQIKMCLTILGKEPLETETAELLWRDLVKVYKTAEDIPEDELKLLGWIAKGIPARDFTNLSLTDIDTIAAFGKWRNLSNDQLASLKQAIEYQWSYKEPSDLSGFDLAALGQVLCAFNTTQIAAIKPLAFKAAAVDISKLINCPKDIIKEFATLATNKDAFGNPSEWTAIQVALIGCIISGMNSIKDIQSDAFEGIGASNMQCLSSDTLQAMSIDQLSHLSLSAINALTYAQRSSLNREQINAIQGTGRTLSSVLNNDGCNNYRTTWLIMPLTAHLLVYYCLI